VILFEDILQVYCFLNYFTEVTTTASIMIICDHSMADLILPNDTMDFVTGTTSDANCQQGKQPPVSSYPANIAGKAAYTAALSSAAAGAVACAMATCTATEMRSAAVAANAVNTLTVTTAGNAQAAYPEAARAASSAATAATSVAAIATVASYLNGKDPAKLQLAGQLVVAAEQHVRAKLGGH
jgi:hypothetical protein